MIGDPWREVLDIALRTPDDAGPNDVAPADRAALELARRRFGVGLPPPYARPPTDPAELPIRPAGSGDGPAIAVIQRRAWRARYRGLLSDAFLDALDLSYLGPYWSGRAAVSPSRRHRLLVAGSPGQVFAAVDTGPSRDDDDEVAPDGTPITGELRSFYVDPTVIELGLGSVLHGQALDALVASGFTGATLWVVEGNAPARSFYEAKGWRADGATTITPVESEELHEVRYRYAAPLGPS